MHDYAGVPRRFATWLFASLFFAALLIPVTPDTASHAEASASGVESLSSETVRQRGQQLRSEIDATYRLLKKSNAVKSSLEGGNDITAIALKYIPLGTSFADAEAIVRAAGCSIVPLANGEVSARSNLQLGRFDIYPHSVDIKLTPLTAGESSTVRQLSATIFAKYVPNADRR